MEFLIGWVVFTILVGVMASNYGRSVIGWVLLSLVLSPLIGFVGLLVAGKSDDARMATIRKEEEMRARFRRNMED